MRLPLAIAAVIAAAINVTVAVGPAYASYEACAQLPEEIRTAAAAAQDEKAATRALRRVETAELLCDAGNERAARKHFTRAIKYLGLEETEMAELASR